MRKNIFITMSITALLTYGQAYAQMEDGDCDDGNCDDTSSSTLDPVKTIYPYKPVAVPELKARIAKITENDKYVSNVFTMSNAGLDKGAARNRPWAGPFWALNQGMIANPYQGKDYKTFIFSAVRLLSWKRNVNAWHRRKEGYLNDVMKFDEDQLAKLAPSEKYDLLLGDTNFDLTNKIWEYTEKWGNEKKWGFLSSIAVPDGYRIPESNKMMAMWEGICHGWAVASGNTPRPENTVYVTLKNGKRMPFYPSDIKALVSLVWANSNVQDNVLSEGLRCNRKNPDQDKYGRYIDTKKDKDDTELLPRCADVHPGIFHVATVNIMGREGRSFVLDQHAEASIGNQPAASYSIEYFNPKNGDEGSLTKSVLSVEKYGKDDPFRASRTPQTKYIVGATMKLVYANWEYPRKGSTDLPKDDKMGDMEFSYDLELDANYEVVGGQWRVSHKGRKRRFGKPGQPDFFWVVPRDHKQYFQEVSTLPKWDFNKSTVPPKEFGPAARYNDETGGHGFHYKMNAFFNGGVSHKCPVIPENGGAPVMVDCEFSIPKPRPLINVVNVLLNQSKR
jgi:Transglutaminase elicitor